MMIPFEHVFWSNPRPEFAVPTVPGAGWHFPAGAFSSPLLRLQDWIGPWPEIHQAYWRSECCHDTLVAGNTQSLIGLQLVAMTYDTSNQTIVDECEFLCSSPQSAPYNRCVTAALKPIFGPATPARNNAIQIAVRMRSDTPGWVYSSRLLISFKP
jgi:hypothetical protein